MKIIIKRTIKMSISFIKALNKYFWKSFHSGNRATKIKPSIEIPVEDVPTNISDIVYRAWDDDAKSMYPHSMIQQDDQH